VTQRIHRPSDPDYLAYLDGIARRLTDLRERAGDPVSKVAVALDVPEATVHAWEAGLREPSFMAMCYYSGTYGVDTRWIEYGGLIR
jgi:transcriptional regulator with XRE-family HTH domain